MSRLCSATAPIVSRTVFGFAIPVESTSAISETPMYASFKTSWATSSGRIRPIYGQPKAVITYTLTLRRFCAAVSRIDGNALCRLSFRLRPRFSMLNVSEAASKIRISSICVITARRHPISLGTSPT